MPLVAVEVDKPILPVAKFSENITGGTAPLSVVFTDLSQNATSRSWDFESDGKIDSSEENPVHTYTTPGIYTVNLTASNENGSTYSTVIISIIEENADMKQSSIVNIPGFEAVYGVFGLFGVLIYMRS